MTALYAMAGLGALCWLFRIAFITVVPANRLPIRVRTSLEHLAPSVLAALTAVELVGLTRGAEPGRAAALLAGAVAIALIAFRWRNLSLVSALGLAFVLVLDLVALPL